MWEKYRHESKQTICIIGVIVLSVKLAEADGDFSILEEEEILKIIPHELEQERILKDIIKEATEDDNNFEYHALRLKKLLDDDHPEFLEFILAVLYKIAHSDHEYSTAEDLMIRKVAEVFDIKESMFEIFTKK